MPLWTAEGGKTKLGRYIPALRSRIEACSVDAVQGLPVWLPVNNRRMACSVVVFV